MIALFLILLPLLLNKSSALTVLVSIDAYRFDWIHLGFSPFLARLGRINVLKPQYPTSTFPNHYTIVTGQRPETHGLINNNFWDPELQREFHIPKTKLNSEFWQGKPIWVSAKEQGLRVSCVYYPGCDVEISGQRPNRWFPFKDDTPAQIVEKALESLVQDSPDMLIVYFSILDVLAHRYGPDSNEVIDAMKLLDQQIQRLVEGILEHEPEAKLIILSDHGMVYVPPDHNIMIADILPSFNDRVAWVNEGTVLLIWPKDKNDEKKLYDDLVEAFSKKGQNHARVWLKEEIQISDGTWAKPRNPLQLGVHGYDPRHPEMDAILILYGPAFSPTRILDPDHRPEPISILNIYNLMARLLKINPEAHDGSENDASFVLAAK